VTTCNVPGCTAHYGCSLRHKGVQTKAGLPGNRRRGPGRFISETNCSWEAGIAGESRPGGTFMPYLGAEGHPIPIKEFGENRRKYEEARRRLAQSPEGGITS
jgi:hypothetical protein